MRIGLMVILVIIVIYVVITLNSFVKLKNDVVEAFATMDVYLKKRWDLIPNLVNVVKSYSTYEAEALENIIKTRYDSLNTNSKISENEKIAENLSKIIALVEAYPELKANSNFLDLSESLTSIENDIANSRKYYNAVVRIYNNKIEMFPSNIIAKLFGFKDYSSFQIDEDEKNNVEVSL